MKKMNKILLAISTCVLGLTACTDKLDIEQHGVDVKETFYTTDENILSAEAEMFIAFRQAPANATAIGLPSSFYGCMDWAWINNKEGASDNAWSGGGGRGENIDGDAVSEWSLDSDNPSIRAYYVLLYCIIYRANLILDNVEEGQSSIGEMVRAEARVIRDFAYFELVTLWGNVPLIDHCLNTDEYKVANSTPAEIWSFLEEDLNTAINSGKLPEKTSAYDKTTWRATKQFAQALLGKVYLWQNKNTEAATQFENVINSNKYALFDGEYGDMMHAGADFNCESMFEINRVPDASTSQGFQFKGIYFNLRADKFDFTGSGVQGVASDYFETSGWGICVPTQQLYDAFLAEEGPNGYRFKQTIRSYSEYKKDYGIQMVNGAVALGDSVWYWKSRYIKSDREGISSNRSYQSRYMRYAEVLLLAAEANLAIGNNAKADEYYNQIRTRAKLPTRTGVTLEQIKTEKRLELCGEGVRLQDLLRWGDAEKYLGANGEKLKKGVPHIECNDGKLNIVYVNYYSGPDSYGYKSSKPYWPIPAMEIATNPNMVQNPGY